MERASYYQKYGTIRLLILSILTHAPFPRNKVKLQAYQREYSWQKRAPGLRKVSKKERVLLEEQWIQKHQLMEMEGCHDPSHGGSYMVEGRLLIRIGLRPRRCLRGLTSWSWSLHVLSRTFPLCCVSCVGPTVPPAVARVPFYPIAPCSWGCNSTSHCLVIMRVCVRLHGTLYPMTDCVLYLGRLL